MKAFAVSGLIISIAGAYLDFASGASMTGNSAMMTPSITSAGLYVLGALVLATGIAMVIPQLMPRMRTMAALMETYGVAMVLVSSWVPGMDMTISFLMLAVGGLMILNGALMAMSKKGAKM